MSQPTNLCSGLVRRPSRSPKWMPAHSPFQGANSSRDGALLRRRHETIAIARNALLQALAGAGSRLARAPYSATALRVTLAKSASALSTSASLDAVSRSWRRSGAICSRMLTPNGTMSEYPVR